MFKIAHLNESGVLAITTLVDEWVEEQAGALAITPQQFAQIEAEKLNGVLVSDFPENREFRNAWELKAGKVAVNMPKAREIFKNKTRATRAALLQSLDADYMKADETGDSAKKLEVATKKQKLRDATKDARIEAAKTPEELSNLNVLDV